MDYNSAIMEYAEKLQCYTPYGHIVLYSIDEKIKAYSSGEGELERRDFWVCVKGILMKHCLYNYLESIKAVETAHKNVSKVYSLTVERLKRKGSNLSVWIRVLDEIAFCIDNTFDIIDEMSHLPTAEEEAAQCTKRSLIFWDNALVNYGFSEQMFPYIQLVWLAIQNLMVSGRYSSKFDNYMLTKVIPVIAVHDSMAVNFVRLIQNEPKHLQETPGVSNYFNAAGYGVLKYEEVKIIENITPDLTLLKHNIANKIYALHDRESVDKEKRTSPLYSYYKYIKLAEELGVVDSTEYITSRHSMNQLYRTFNVQSSSYSGVTLCAILTRYLKQVLETSAEHALYDLKIEWQKRISDVRTVLRVLQDDRVISVNQARSVLIYIDDNNKVMFGGVAR